MIFSLLGLALAQNAKVQFVSDSDDSTLYQGTALKYQENGADVEAGVNPKGFYLKSQGFVTDQYNVESDDNSKLFLEFGKQALLQFANDNGFSQVFADILYDSGAAPYTGVVEYDRKFRVYDRNVNTVFEFPNSPKKATSLKLIENGSTKTYANFLRTGEYLTDADGKWFIYINEFGAIVDNNGNIYNENVSAIKTPRVLEMNRYGGLYLKDNTGETMVEFRKVDVPPSPKPTASQTLFITGDGLVQFATGDALFDLSEKGKPINENYFPIISTSLGTCLTHEQGKLMMKVCTPGNYNQFFSYDSDYFRILADPSKCITRSGTDLVVKTCMPSTSQVIFTNVKTDGTIRTKDNMCFKVTSSSISLASCNLWGTATESFTWTQNYINPKNLQFRHIYNNDNSTKITSFANGWLEADLSKVVPLILSNTTNDNVKWAFDPEGKIRFSQSPAYCMQATTDGVKPVICNTASKWLYDTNRLLDANKFNCLVQSGTDLEFKRCGSADPALTQWWLVDDPSVNPGNQTSGGQYTLLDTYELLNATYFGKMGIDKNGLLHKEDFCYSADLKEIECTNAKVGKFKYEKNQIALLNSDLVMNNQFKMEKNDFLPTQFVVMGSKPEITIGPVSKIYHLSGTDCLGLTNGYLSPMSCDSADNFFTKDNKIYLSRNTNFCLNENKATLCSLATAFATVGPRISTADGKCISGSGMKQCTDQYYSLNKDDILPKDLVYDFLYELNGTNCVGLDSNNRAVPVACDGAPQWGYSTGKMRSKSNPFYCLEIDANNKVVYLPCSTTSWSNNMLRDNTLVANRMCLTTDTQYYIGKCVDSVKQKFSFNQKTPVVYYNKLISFNSNLCLNDQIKTSQCLAVDTQKWLLDTDGTIRNFNGKCLSNTLQLEECGITIWNTLNRQIKHEASNKCLTDGATLSMTACSTADIKQKWFFGQQLAPPADQFQKYYNQASNQCLINCDTSFAVSNGRLIDGSNNNRCYDDKLQPMLCVDVDSHWSLNDGFIRNGDQCLDDKNTLRYCNPNDLKLMWSTDKFTLSLTWEQFYPSLTVTANSTLLELGSSDVRFSIDGNGFIRNSLNPFYCLGSEAKFVLCERGLKWSRGLVSDTLCVQSGKPVTTAKCNNSQGQQWSLGTPSAPTQCDQFGWTFYDAQDIVGNDLGSLPATDRNSCQTLCQRFTGCNAYSWKASQKVCYFKGGVDASTKRNQNGDIYSAILCGRNECRSYGVVYFDNRDIPKGDFNYYNVNTVEDCVFWCLGTPGCTAFTRVANACYLKKFSADYPPSVPNGNAQSGVVCRNMS